MASRTTEPSLLQVSRSRSYWKQLQENWICGAKGCKETHNRLLHEEIENEEEKAPNESVRNFMEEETRKEEVTHTTLDFQQQNHVTLRTVPVIVKNGGMEKIVNALLDDGSTKTYINDDIAALNLGGEIRKVTVKVLNNRVETFQTMPVEFELESANGEFKTKLTAYTTERVTGNVKIVNWKICANRWEHLKDIEFPDVGKKPFVDMLIGIDHADLHFSLKEVRGKKGEPIARLTPLGWTCIGNSEDEAGDSGCCRQTVRSLFTHDG